MRTEDSNVSHSERRLIMVSNRLPVTLTRSHSDTTTNATSNTTTATTGTTINLTSASPVPSMGKLFENENVPEPEEGLQAEETEEFGHLSFKKSSGGLVSALNSCDMKFSWVGWLGAEMESPKEEVYVTKRLSEYNYAPVFLEAEEADLYYNGFSNSVLWPLFHYMTSFDLESNFNDSQWKAYQQVNEKFADAVLSIYRPGDLVWVHDYHLMLLPAILRQRAPDIDIGFFLHIPFPTSEIYRTLPVRKELLEGLLASNLIGFHTYNYCRHFLSSCTRILGNETTATGVFHNGMFVTVNVFPIGIDPYQFQNCVEQPETKQRVSELKEKYKGKKIFLGIDRVDYTKGLPLKLQAYENFLAKYPERARDTVLVQIGVPTREQATGYQDLINKVNGLVGKINSKFGSLDGFPVHYINKSVDFTDLCALYYVADVCIVSPLRDGMNLVSFEYLAAKKSCPKSGVLLLSEFAGSANSLSGSILINPWDITKTADQMQSALDMSTDEETNRFKLNIHVVEGYTASDWARHFVEDLDKARESNKSFMSSTPLLPQADAINKFCSSSSKRLFILDYDTLFLSKGFSNSPSKSRHRHVLKQLANDTNNLVYIVSGHTRKHLDTLFPDNTFGLCAEYGAFWKQPGQQEWQSLFDAYIDTAWIKEIEPMLLLIAQRTPGATCTIRERSACLDWRNCESQYGVWKANDTKLFFEQTLANAPVELLYGKKVIDLLSISCNKTSMIKKLLATHDDCDFIFCAGVDRPSEDMFQALESVPHAMTCIIGKVEKFSHAKYRLVNNKNLLNLLECLAKEQII